MGGRLTALSVCVAIVALAGCGSSSSPTSSSLASAPKSTQTATASLKVTTTPKFAGASGRVLSGIVPVAYRNIAIAPDTLRVKVGSTIKWTNYDSIQHNVTSQSGSQSFASKDFGERGTFEVKALKPGLIHYVCTIHPASMNGTIEVLK